MGHIRRWVLWQMIGSWVWLVSSGGRLVLLCEVKCYEPESTLIRDWICFAPRSWTFQELWEIAWHLQATHGSAAAVRWDAGRFGALWPLFPNVSPFPYLFKQLQNLDPCSDIDRLLSFAYNFPINIVAFLVTLFIDPHPGYFMSASWFLF